MQESQDFDDIDFYIFLSEKARKQIQEVHPKQSPQQQLQEEDQFLFQTQEDMGQGAVNIKPWESQIFLSSLKPPQNPMPTKSLKLCYVNGINVLQSNQNTFYSNKGEVIFPAACLGVVMNPKDMSQKYFGGGEKNQSTQYHRFDITSLDYCAQTDMVATGSASKNPEICLWNASQLNLILKFRQGQQTVAVGFIRICQTKKCIFTCDRSDDVILRAFNMQGKQLCSIAIRCTVFAMAVGSKYDIGIGSTDGVLLINWQGKKFKKSDYKKQMTTSICFNQVGQAIFGTKNGMIYKMSKHKQVHKGAIFAINCKKELIYSSGKDFKIAITNMQLQPLKSINLQQYAKSIDIFNQKIIIATKNGKLIELQGNVQKQLINGHFAGQLWGLTYNPIHQEFITAGDDNKVIVYDFKKRKVINQIQINHKKQGKISDLSPLTQFRQNQQARAVDYNPPNEDLAFFLLNGELQIYQTTHSYEPKYIKKICNSWSQIIRYSPDGKYLAIGCYDSVIYILDADIYQSLGKLTGHSKPIKNLDWSTDSQFIRSSCGKAQLMYWEISSYSKINKTVIEKAEWASSNKFSAQTNKIWYDIIAPEFVNQISRSHNGQMFVLGDNEGCVKVYSCPAVLRKYKTYKAHSKKVINLCWSKNDNYVATVGGYDKALIIWQVI